jgi:3-hydroxyisobutyrate dehydrogenase
MKIGFVGLGLLGSAMVRRLSSQGVPLTLWNRTLDKAKNFGLPYTNTLAQLFEENEVVFLCLRDSLAVEEVLKEVEPNLSGKVVVDTTTNSYFNVLKFHKFVQNRGGVYLECPVLGSVIPAERGELTILVSGDEEAYKRVESLLNLLGKKIIYFGEPGKATKAKLINNYVLGLFMEAISSTLVLGERVGLSKAEVLEVLENGAGNSYLLKVKKTKLLEEDFSPHFSINNLYKDLNYAEELFKSYNGIALEGSVVREVYKLCVAMGLGEEDISAVYEALKRLVQAPVAMKS